MTIETGILKSLHLHSNIYDPQNLLEYFVHLFANKTHLNLFHVFCTFPRESNGASAVILSQVPPSDKMMMSVCSHISPSLSRCHLCLELYTAPLFSWPEPCRMSGTPKPGCRGPLLPDTARTWPSMALATACAPTTLATASWTMCCWTRTVWHGS